MIGVVTFLNCDDVVFLLIIIFQSGAMLAPMSQAWCGYGVRIGLAASRPYVERYIRPIMQTNRLCGLSPWGARQSLTDRDRRVVGAPHNHSVLRNSINESGAR